MNTFFAKIITVIMSILCTLNIVSTTDYQRPEPTYDPLPFVDEVEVEEANDNSDVDLVEDEDVAASAKETDNKDSEVKEEKKDEQEVKAPVEETKDENGIDENNLQGAYAENNDVVEDNENNDYEVIDEIDISAEKNGSVKMTLYAVPTEDNDAAAFSMGTRNATVTTEPTKGRIYDENVSYVKAVINGEGEMEKNVYNHFVNVDKFINTTKTLLAKKYGIAVEDIRHDLPEGVTDLIDIDTQIKYFAKTASKAGPAGTQLHISDDIRAAINPADMLENSPTVIEFGDKVESISDGAFLFCSELTEIEIPASVKRIGANAFSYCTNLKKVVIKDGLESIGARAFMHCRNLETITLPSTITSIGEEAFILMKQDSYILCPNYDVFLLADKDGLYTQDVTLVDFTEEAYNMYAE